MIVYTNSLEGTNAPQLQGFFVGWPNPPSAETHLRMLSGSDDVVLAVDDESGTVVGYVTAISDGVLTAFIPALEVLPAFQGQGIGTELMRRMLDRLGTLNAVDLLCNVEAQPFYTRLGMMRATGMAMRRCDRQSGEPAGGQG